MVLYKLSSPKCLNIQPVTNDGGTDIRKEGGNMNVHGGGGVGERQRERGKKREKVHVYGDIRLLLYWV